MSVRMKIWKKRFSNFATKKRYMGNHPKSKKAIFIGFLLAVNSWVLFNLSLAVPKIEIRLDGGFSYENHARASNMKPSDVVVKEKSIEEKIAETFPENPKLMIAVFKAESGLNPMTVHQNNNGTRDIGIAQINSVHGEDDLKMFDVDNNLKAARKVYDKQGITAWSSFVNNGYKQYYQ